MPENFYDRLHDYFENVAKVLRGEAAPASIFPNSTDIGSSREKAYAKFLKIHTPSKCNVLFGGFLFHENGDESKQIDIIINVDTTPRFDFCSLDGTGKTFSPVEGTVGVVSVKSTLDKAQLFDALDNIASIPPMSTLKGRKNPMIKIPNYDDWPYKIIYASDGRSGKTIMKHLVEYFKEHSEIPTTRQPHVIHVAGKYAIFRLVEGMAIFAKGMEINGKGTLSQIGTFHLIETKPDLHAIMWALDALQKKAQASSHILYNYEIINRVMKI